MPRRRPETSKPDRPRERLEALGPEALSDAELVALLLRTGTRGRDALALASGLLAQHGGLQGLARSSAEDLARSSGEDGRPLPGLGPAKAATLRACVELGRRLAAGRQRHPDQHPFRRNQPGSHRQSARRRTTADGLRGLVCDPVFWGKQAGVMPSAASLRGEQKSPG